MSNLRKHQIKHSLKTEESAMFDSLKAKSPRSSRSEVLNSIDISGN